MAKTKSARRTRRSLLTITATARGQRSPALPGVKAAPPPTTSSATGDALAFQTEVWRRSVLFLDTLRVRASDMLAHEQAGRLLNFDYETILDARRCEHPANYALLRITGPAGKRMEECVDEKARPVIISDPRAGHGPGIGGFKRDSEVGMALHEGHPTYFRSTARSGAALTVRRPEG